jgi:hypothetical protein
MYWRLGACTLVTSLQRVWLRTNDRLTNSGVESFAKAQPGVMVDDEALRIPDSRAAQIDKEKR